MTKQDKRLCELETSGGTYSARKVPQWHMRKNDLLEYLDMLRDEWGDTLSVFNKVTSVAVKAS